MQPQFTPEQLIAALTQLTGQATQETVLPDAQLSEEAKKAKAARDASIEKDAQAMSDAYYTFLTSLGLSIDTMASQNAQSGKQAMFTYNSTRYNYEQAAGKLNYFNSQAQNEINMTRIQELEAIMSEQEVRMEEQEVINRAAQITFERLFADFSQTNANVVDFDQRNRREDNFLTYNSVEPISDAAYQVFARDREQRYNKRNQMTRQQAAQGAHLLRQTERRTSFS